MRREDNMMIKVSQPTTINGKLSSNPLIAPFDLLMDSDILILVYCYQYLCAPIAVQLFEKFVAKVFCDPQISLKTIHQGPSHRDLS